MDDIEKLTLISFCYGEWRDTTRTLKAHYLALEALYSKYPNLRQVFSNLLADSLPEAEELTADQLRGFPEILKTLGYDPLAIDMQKFLHKYEDVLPKAHPDTQK